MGSISVDVLRIRNLITCPYLVGIEIAMSNCHHIEENFFGRIDLKIKLHLKFCRCPYLGSISVDVERNRAFITCPYYRWDLITHGAIVAILEKYFFGELI